MDKSSEVEIPPAYERVPESLLNIPAAFNELNANACALDIILCVYRLENDLVEEGEEEEKQVSYILPGSEALKRRRHTYTHNLVGKEKHLNKNLLIAFYSLLAELDALRVGQQKALSADEAKPEMLLAAELLAFHLLEKAVPTELDYERFFNFARTLSGHASPGMIAMGCIFIALGCLIFALSLYFLMPAIIGTAVVSTFACAQLAFSLVQMAIGVYTVIKKGFAHELSGTMRQFGLLCQKDKRAQHQRSKDKVGIPRESTVIESIKDKLSPITAFLGFST